MPRQRSAPRSTGGRAPLRLPLQARSQDTLERIVAATQGLLETRSFDAISIAEVAERARSSVGAFYARFPDKEALLDHLDERYGQETIATIDAFLADAARRRPPLARLVARLVELLVDFHGARPGLLRALVLRARERPGLSTRERTARIAERLPRVFALLDTYAPAVRHPDPARAVRVGFAMVFAAIREHLLFPETLALGRALPERALARELARAYLAYLGVAPDERAP